MPFYYGSVFPSHRVLKDVAGTWRHGTQTSSSSSRPWGGGRRRGTSIDGPSHVHVLLICICRKHWNPFSWGRYKNKWSGLGVRMNWNTSIKLRTGDGGGWGTLLAKTGWNKQNDSVVWEGRGVRSIILRAEFHSYKEGGFWWVESGWDEVQGRFPSFLNSHNPLVPHALLRSF